MKTTEFNKELTALNDSLTGFAYSLTSNFDDAKDLVQETFLKALTYKDQFENNTNLRAWAFTIMRNTFINGYRKGVRQATTFDSTDNQFLLNSRSDKETPESVYSAGEISKQIRSLEPEFRIPFQMHSSGYKYKEIADALDLKIGTVKSRIFFSRKKLMDAINELKD